ncbi:Mrp/NBP35 family ATP-binding protein [Helicobacter sp. 11S02596-1]|uniref:Mrp/NBP35 family ATP-binding protein n=1 Tax=Helicobacter sp. 11S02596-1 TaxID=1476194 RepID=UPI000BA75452|nr:Mrp/NBP35 family ATP-binding protein [Helicobacter sp. 11S02596-1]PAF45110.1 sodium:proton antiporter [Helicobacter sp. 11S02596-1]
MITQDTILETLKTIIYPNFEKDIVSFGFLKNITLHEDRLALLLEIPSSAPEVCEELQKEIKAKVSALGIKECQIDIKTPPKPQSQAPITKNLAPQIKHFVMISSGKGGVGKSTTSANIAIALAQQGKKVGLLDADVYGPNIPRMLGLNTQKPNVDSSGKRLIPLKAFGVEMMSMGVLYEEGQSLIWRGPMLMRAIEQMLTDVLWSDLDILVMDMPPGTGDAQLSMAQSVPVSAGITVTTPQQVSLDDSSRSLDMFVKLHIPIAGVIENMSGFVCPDCGKEYDIFGKGTSEVIAKKYHTNILAEIPLEPKVREGGDSGKPIVFFDPESFSAKAYVKAALALIEFLKKVEEEKLADNQSIQPTQDNSHLHS